MSWRVSIRPQGIDDIHQASDWYERQRPGLGGEFQLSIVESMTRLEESPESFPVYYRSFRRLLVGRFPYKVFFIIQGDAVIVFRVLHAARDHARELS